MGAQEAGIDLVYPWFPGMIAHNWCSELPGSIELLLQKWERGIPSSYRLLPKITPFKANVISRPCIEILKRASCISVQLRSAPLESIGDSYYIYNILSCRIQLSFNYSEMSKNSVGILVCPSYH